jgi:hypothetical protein
MSPNDSTTGAFGAIGVILIVLFYLAAIGFGIYLYMRVARKSGYPMAYGLLMLIPVANLVFIIMFVFTEWPIERRVRELEQALATAGGLPGPGASAYGGAAGYPGTPAYPGTPGYPTVPGAPATGYPQPGTSYPPSTGSGYPQPGGGYPPSAGTGYPPAPSTGSWPPAGEPGTPPANPYDPPTR